MSQWKTQSIDWALHWLGRRDSNPRMPGPKPGALPLGHALLFFARWCANWYILVHFYRSYNDRDGAVADIIT